jgi:TolA-binding protein
MAKNKRWVTRWSIWSAAASLACNTLFFEQAAAETGQLALQAKKTKTSSPPQTKSDTSRWSPIFPRLFKAPTDSPRTFFSDVVGSDLESVNASAQAAATRAVQIQQVEAEFKMQPPKSQQALNLGLRLVKLLEEQALYVEFLRASGGADPRYPDLNHFVRVSRSQVVNTINTLIKNFPKNESVAELRPLQIMSRLKIGDPTVRDEAFRYAKQGKTTGQLNSALVGMSMDFDSKKDSSRFGTLEFAINNSPDAGSRAAFRYYAAEAALAKQQYAKATTLYQDALKDLGKLRRADGKRGPLLGRVLFRLYSAALLKDPMNRDNEVIQSMQSADAVDFARAYAELIALNNLAKQPSRAAGMYADVQALGDYSKAFAASIEIRILDIHLASKDLVTAQSQWQRVVQLGDVVQTQLPARILYTQNLAYSQAQSKLDSESIKRFVALHDFFTENSQDYAAREDWSLKVVGLLWKARRASETAVRADALAGRTKSRDVLLASLRFSLRARESMLSLSAEPKFIRSRKLSGDEQIAQAYIVTLDKMKTATSGVELEQSIFQAAYLTQLIGQENPGRQRFEEALNKYPTSKYSPEAVSYLIDAAEKTKDWPYVEKIARLALKQKISPSKEQHKNLRVIVENAVYSHAQQLASKGEFEAAANRFVAFQKEFTSHKNASTALDLAARNFLQAKKTEAAVTQMEVLLKTYPSSGYVKETTWQAAELSRGIAQFLRAAKHYEDFARKYSQDGIKRTAWLKSAEMHKSLGRYANAVAHYENYLAQLNGNSEKLKIAREIADLHFKHGRPAEAIAAYERMMKFISASDDEIYLRSQILTIQLRQGAESMARRTAARILNLKPNSQDSFRLQAKAKYSVAYLEAPTVRTRNLQNEKNLLSAIKTTVADYDRLKALFLAACEVPGLEYCSSAYYESARLAEEIAKNILAIDLPPTLNPAEVESIRSLMNQNSERLQQESKSFAVQAEQALSSGAPDAETAERIRNYVQQVRGESIDAAPLEQ